MALSAGDAYLDVHARLARDTGRRLSSQLETPAGRAGTEASKHFGRKFAAGLAVGGALIGAGLFRATKAAARGIQAATDKASDLNETINKTNIVFGKNAAEIQKWSRGSAKNMGLSRQEALANAAAFGDMFLQLKIGAPQATTMSKKMVGLAADFASFSNADISDVLLAQQSAFRGEYDALQRFVPGINAARVEQEALRETHKKSAKELTLAEKAQATYNIMLKDGRRATGDFARTSNQLANTRRIEKAQIEDLQAAIGQRFLPAQLALHRALSSKLLPALGVLVKTYGPAVERFATMWATKFAAAIPSTRQLTLGLKALGEAFRGNGITTSGDSFVGKMERIGVAARKLVDWFKELRPQFSGVSQSASQFGPALSQAGGGGHVLANTLAIMAPVLEVVARNIHNIVPLLPGLVAGFLAFRAVRTAIAPVSAIGEAIRNFATPALVVATFAQARANKALAASLAERTVATVAATRADAGLVVSTTAAGNAAGAATGKFALFGTGLSGLVGKLGLFAAAAAAGAYQGKQLADATTKGTRVSGPFAEQRAKILRTLGLEATVAQKVADAQRGLVAATANGATAANRYAGAVRAEKQAIDALKGALAGEETAELDVRQAKLSVATAQARLTELTKAGKKGSLDYKQAQIDLKRAQVDLKERTTAYKDAQRQANAATAGAMHATQQAISPTRKYGEAARAAGIRLYTSGTKAREGMGIASKAVRGFQQTINNLHGKKFTISATAAVRIADSVRAYAKLANVPGFHATGGPIHGPGTGTSDSIPAMLSAGEHVWTAKEVQKAGGHGAVEAMRQQVTRGYARGGPVLDVPVRLTKSGDILKQFYHPTVAATRRVGQKITAGFAKLIGAGLGKAINEGISGGRASIKAFIRSVDSHPYVWGGAGPGGYDCSGLVSAVYGKHTGRGGGHGQRYFTTSSIGGAGLARGPGGVLQIGVTPGHHMAGRYGGLGFEAESTRTGIKIGSAASPPWTFPVQYHLAKGGRVRAAAELAKLGIEVGGDPGGMWLRRDKRIGIFDRGGTLTPGLNLVANTTGRDEPLVPAGKGGIDYDKLGRAVANALSSQPVRAYVDANQARQAVKDAQRRGGIPRPHQIR